MIGNKYENCAGCDTKVLVGLLGPFRWDAHLWTKKNKYTSGKPEPVHKIMHEKMVCQSCFTMMECCAIGLTRENGAKKCKYCTTDLPKFRVTSYYPCGRKKGFTEGEE